MAAFDGFICGFGCNPDTCLREARYGGRREVGEGRWPDWNAGSRISTGKSDQR
jgi:hypothetical protein